MIIFQGNGFIVVVKHFSYDFNPVFMEFIQDFLVVIVEVVAHWYWFIFFNFFSSCFVVVVSDGFVHPVEWVFGFSTMIPYWVTIAELWVMTTYAV